MTGTGDRAQLPTTDGRQSEAALAIQRGARRLLAQHGYASVPEVTLPSGRRADLMAIGRSGEIWIVEIKSSVADFMSDQKWPDYRAFADRLLFAVAPAFPLELIPPEVGLIVADRYGGELLREAPLHKLAPARARSLQLRLARLAAARLQAIDDPEQRWEEAWLD